MGKPKWIIPKRMSTVVDVLVISMIFKRIHSLDDDYPFRSQRAQVLKVQSVHRLVKSWCKAINLKGNYGSHTLRKTWGCHQRVPLAWACRS